MYNLALIAMGLKAKAVKVLTKKVDGVEGYVVAIVICALSLALGYVFRDALTTFIQTLVNRFTTQTTNLF